MSILDKLNKFKRINNLIVNSVEMEYYKHDNYNFYRIDKVIIPENMKEEREEKEKYMDDGIKFFCQSMRNRTSPFIYCIKGDAKTKKTEVLLGTYKEKEDIAEKAKAFFRNISYQYIEKIENLDDLKYQGVVTGIPDKENTKSYIDALMKFMVNKDYVLSIVSKPLSSQLIKGIQNNLVEERNRNYSSIKKSIGNSIANSEGSSERSSTTYNDNNGLAFIASRQEGKSISQDSTSNNTSTITDTKGTEVLNSASESYDKLLEKHLQRIDEAQANGLWETTICISTKQKEDLKLALDVFSAIYSNNAIEPFKVYICKNNFSPISVFKSSVIDSNVEEHILYGDKAKYINLLTGEELALFVGLPKEDYNGYSIISIPRFSQKSAVYKDGIKLGYLNDSEVKTSLPFGLSYSSLSKHILIAGITGSGKTNTVFSILKNLKVPFLVIEPAKTEYRALKTLVKELKIYTLGQEQVSPFRLNPFKFGNNITIQQHIDNLKVIFTAAFTMYASMPNILEQCLNNIYIKKGWSLVTSKNIYCTNEVSDDYYPTIEDLYYEIDNYIDNLGYAQEQTQNIRAALLTRIKSLMTGGKGYMINTTCSISTEELLKYPTILELDGIADDEEKSLIIGFVMMNIYEFLKGQVEGYNNNLKHVIVMEEAHRLFTNTTNVQNQEVVNIKGKAVETLSNILCEVRAYGEGFIVVDQVPVKLAPDVLKNTNTKIIHRLVSKDDCEYIGNSLSISEEKSGYISKLTVGSAIVYNDEMEEACHVHIEMNKDRLEYFNDRAVKEYSKEYNNFAHNIKEVHPLVEILLQNKKEKEAILLTAKRLVDGILKEKIEKLNELYNTACNDFKTIAEENGYSIDGDLNSYLNSIITESINILLKMDKKLTNNINKRIYLLSLMDTAKELIKLDFNDYDKIYRAFDISRKNLYKG